ncbi:MAG TPA: hypothetical protein VGP40_07055, partial [Chthoniobacterales bacterium]|nr:hypothetical protein [Chthoniobacterales bacterium]
LTVTATVAADYSLSAAPVSIAQGGSGSTAVTISRTNFTGDVTLSLSGAPTGVTGSFNPNPATGTSSTLTLNVGSGVAPGTYTLTVNGSGTPGTRSTTFTLTVTGTGGGSGVTLNYAACPAAEKPVWLAYQDGNGPWTRVTSTNDIYSFTFTTGRAGLAYVLLPGAGVTSEVHVQYYTSAEFSGNINFCGPVPPPPPTGKTINGTVAGVTSSQAARISLNGGSAFTAPAIPGFPAFQIMGVQNGTFDLIGYRGAFSFGNTTTDRAIIRRDQNIPDGGSVGTMDFEGAESFAVQSATISIAGLAAGDTTSAILNYQTGASCTGTAASLSFTSGNAGSSFTAYGIPAAQQRPSDFHNIFVTASSSTSSRIVSETFHTFGARTVTLGGELNPSITSLGGPYKRLQAAYTLPPGYNLATTFNYDDNSRFVYISATFAYLGGSSVTLGLPDFTAVSGWDNSWPPPPSSTVDTVVTAIGSTGTPCTEGARTVIATRTGSFTVR